MWWAITVTIPHQSHFNIWSLLLTLQPVWTPFLSPSSLPSQSLPVHYILSNKTTSVSKVSPHYPNLYILLSFSSEPLWNWGCIMHFILSLLKLIPSGGQGTVLGGVVWGVGVEIRKKRGASVIWVTPPSALPHVPLSLAWSSCRVRGREWASGGQWRADWKSCRAATNKRPPWDVCSEPSAWAP